MSSFTSAGEALWPDGPPRAAWHSFDATPWLHPWLTRRNLSAMREASAGWVDEARRVVAGADPKPGHFAFVGNIANGMYMRAKALARTRAQVDVFGLYADDSVFSDPRWEEYDGVHPDAASYLSGEKEFLKSVHPQVPFAQFEVAGQWAVMRDDELPSYARRSDFQRWRGHFSNIPAFERLQAHDAVLACQKPYIAYLAGRPYAATQMGGDIWLEASRDDELGRLQRISFARAGCVLSSNPLTYSHARRYGFNNVIQLPFILSEDDFSPGPPTHRSNWQAKTGGDFFVLSTARADDVYKGSRVGLEGFAEFSRTAPGARLVFIAWGADMERLKERARQLEILDRVLFVPVSGKRLLVQYLRSADCLLDQFVLGYYGATAIEGAGCGTPVIMRYESAQYEALFDCGAPPFYNAATSAEVADALDLIASAEEGVRKDISARHRNWFLQSHSGRRWGDDYVAVLSALALGHKFDFSKSPLTAVLSAAENAYHAEQLTNAPTFPNYQHAPGGQDVAKDLSQMSERLSVIEEKIGSISRLEALVAGQSAAIENLSGVCDEVVKELSKKPLTMVERFRAMLGQRAPPLPVDDQRVPSPRRP